MVNGNPLPNHRKALDPLHPNFMKALDPLHPNIRKVLDLLHPNQVLKGLGARADLALCIKSRS